MPPNFDYYGYMPDYVDPYANYPPNQQPGSGFQGQVYTDSRSQAQPQAQHQGHPHFSQAHHPSQQPHQRQQHQPQPNFQAPPQVPPQAPPQAYPQQYPHQHNQPYYQQSQQSQPFPFQGQVPQYHPSYSNPDNTVPQSISQQLAYPQQPQQPQQPQHIPRQATPHRPQNPSYSASPQRAPPPPLPSHSARQQPPQHAPSPVPQPSPQPRVEVINPSQMHISQPARSQHHSHSPAVASESQPRQHTQGQSSTHPNLIRRQSSQQGSVEPPSLHRSSPHLPTEHSPPFGQPSPQTSVQSHTNQKDRAQQFSHITIDNSKRAQASTSPSMAQIQQSQSSQPRQKPKEQVKRPPQTQAPQQLGQPRPSVLQSVSVNSKPASKPAPANPVDRTSKPEHPDAIEPDYPSLLCVLADDYLDAARKQPALTEHYFELVSLALGCLESTLANFKLQPLREAQISLRYAQILYDETENYDEAETRLTKAIEICERNKLVDLKYEMQLLLSKVLYESNPKAAIRESQRMIEDAEAYRHTAWVYALRFQHAMFTLSYSSPGDVHSSTVQLEKVSHLAKQSSDSALLAFAALLEGLMHLSSSSQDALLAAQTALAKARALQLNPDVESSPQMMVLMEFIDLACSIRECNIDQIEKKRGIMIEVIQISVGNPNWRDDAVIYIPISKRSLAGLQVHAGGHVIERGDKCFLAFQWMAKDDVEALGYLLSAESSAYKLGSEVGKGERFAEAGLQLLRSSEEQNAGTGRQVAEKDQTLHRLMEAELLFVLCFIRCAKGQWEAAHHTHAEIAAIADQLGDAFSANLRYGHRYLKGVILQGIGHLDAALEVYQSRMFSLASTHTSPESRGGGSHQISSSRYAVSDATRDFCVLAAMNAIFIIGNPTHPQHHRLPPLKDAVATAIKHSQNKHVQAHHFILISATSSTQLAGKQHLSSALSAAKAIGEAPATTLALAFMYHKFYRATMGEQALKCARAAAAQVQRWGDPLWKHVTTGLYAESLEVNGNVEEAQRKQSEAQQIWEGLPENVKIGGTGAGDRGS